MLSRFSSSSLFKKVNNSPLKESLLSIYRPYSLYLWGTIPGGTPLTPSSQTPQSTNVFSSSHKNQSYYEPTRIDIPSFFNTELQIQLTSIVCGPTSTAVLFNNDTCCTFGTNQHGHLGHNTKDTCYQPTLLELPLSCPLHYNEISQVSLGSSMSAIIDIHGNLYTCGYNGSVLQDGLGSLGHGLLNEESILVPTLVHSLIEDNIYVKEVSVSSSHIVILTTEGELLTTGAGTYGRLGNLELNDQHYFEPVELLGPKDNIKQIETGKDYTLVATEDGIVHAFGQNNKGQCGTGTGLSVEMYAMEPIPIPIEGLLEGRNVVKVAAGYTHAAAITDKGELFIWGQGYSLLPEQIMTMGNCHVVDVVCGKNYTMVKSKEGSIYTVGTGKNGVLGLGPNTKNAKVPMEVESLRGKDVIGMSAGWNHVGVWVNEN